MTVTLSDCDSQRVYARILRRNPWQDRCRCSRAVSFLYRGRVHEIKKGRNGATKPFGFSDRSITISREYKCLREQPTDAVQFGVGPALPFNLVASSLLISFHRPAPSITDLCNFSFRSVSVDLTEYPRMDALCATQDHVPVNTTYSQVRIFRRYTRHLNRCLTIIFICMETVIALSKNY